MSKNKGFSLIEIIVAIVLVAMLFLCVTFSFRSLLSLNILSSKRDQSINLASTILEELSTVRYSDIDDSFRFTFPDDFDLSETVYSLNKKDSNDGSVLILDNIKYGINSYQAVVDFTYGIDDKGVGAEINRYNFPKLSNFGGEDSIIVSTESEIDKFSVNDLGGYDYDTGGYKIQDGYLTYDEEILNNILDSHRNYCDKLYQEAKNTVLAYNETEEGQKNPKPLPNPDDYKTNVTVEKMKKENSQGYKLLKRTLVLDILNSGNSQLFFANLTYDFSIDESIRYMNYLKSIGDLGSAINSFIDVNDTYNYEVNIYNNFNITNLNNLVIVHTESDCALDYIVINNKTKNLQAGDKKFNLFIYDNSTKNEEKYVQGKKLDSSNITDLSGIKINQSFADKVITCYSNNTKDLAYLNGTGKVIIPDNYGVIGNKKEEVRMYRAIVTIKSNDFTNSVDKDGNINEVRKVYYSSSCNILD